MFRPCLTAVEAYLPFSLTRPGADFDCALRPCISESLHVMRAMDIPYTAAHNTRHFSFTCYNNTGEIDEVLEVMPDIAAKLRKLSPSWDSVNNGTGLIQS